MFPLIVGLHHLLTQHSRRTQHVRGLRGNSDCLSSPLDWNCMNHCICHLIANHVILPGCQWDTASGSDWGEGWRLTTQHRLFPHHRSLPVAVHIFQHCGNHLILQAYRFSCNQPTDDLWRLGITIFQIRFGCHGWQLTTKVFKTPWSMTFTQPMRTLIDSLS